MHTLSLSLANAQIAYWDSGNSAPIILFLHGNSSCKEVFLKQFFSPENWCTQFITSDELPSIFDSTLVDNFRLVAFDLPGNGKSSHAPFPTQTYSYLGIAATIQEFLLTLYNKEKDPLWLSPIIVGWSLGGHAAIELINSVHDFHLPSVSGLVLCGTPPVNLTKPSKNNEGFLLNPEILKMKYLSAFSRLQSQQFYTAAGITVTYPHYFINCGQQMDGRARTFLQDWKNTSEAKSINQAATVAETTIPIAVFSGQNDICIDNHYIEKLYFKSLWRQKINYFDCGHAPFWQKPIEFNQQLFEFAKEQFPSALSR